MDAVAEACSTVLEIVVALIVDRVYWVFADQVSSRKEDVAD